MNRGPSRHHDRPEAARAYRAIADPVVAHLTDTDTDPVDPDLAAANLIDAQCELDACDGYVVLAYDPQTGEVDAHGPFVGLHALDTAETMRLDLDREELEDVVVRVVRWHTGDHSVRAA
jgi:hypothetical protein